MEILLDNTNWTVVLVGFAVSFILGWAWYSPLMFLNKWLPGLGTAAVPGRSMVPGMVTQLIATFLFSWSLVVAASFSMGLAVVAALAATAMIKANGFFAGKSMSAIMVESWFMIVQAAIILIAFSIF